MRVLIAGLAAGFVAFQPAAAQDGSRMPITLDPQTGEVVSVVDGPLPFASQDGPTLLAADMAPNSPLPPPPTVSPVVPRTGPEPKAPNTPDTMVHALAPGDVRIKDIASIEGVRENQLVGYGLVVGLQGTGDTLRNAAFSEQSLQSMLERLGVNVRDSALRTRNIAAVIATAELPAFAGAGSRIDVNVASLGDASSLQGGTLIITQLAGADGEVYAVAQGPIAVTGYSAAGMAESVQKGTPTAGRIPNGALIERELQTNLDGLGALTFKLRNPDFRTAIRITDAINSYSRRRYGAAVAEERDYRTVALIKPRGMSAARFIAEIEGLPVRPDAPARVVIDERSGTVVMGADVRISTVAITHGNLSIRVSEAPVASQPAPFSDGETVVLPRTMVDASESGGNLAIIGGTDLQTLVRGLNQIGLKPTGVIAIVQAMKTAGALQADLVVQ
jgi:flagellar P-ring protein precursor FlgI